MARKWTAVFVGNGPEHRALLRLARRLGVVDRVLFAGFRSDAARLYQAADIFALPSHSEGSSNALLEAMSAKLAIVATAIGGNPEILEAGRTALLVPARRPVEMAAALERLIMDPAYARELGEAAFRQVVETYSPTHYRDRLCSYYREALAALPEGWSGRINCVRILTNFINAPDELELPGRGCVEIIKGESWSDIRGSLRRADIVVLNCGGTLLYRLTRHFLLFPWTRRPLSPLI